MLYACSKLFPESDKLRDPPPVAGQFNHCLCRCYSASVSVHYHQHHRFIQHFLECHTVCCNHSLQINLSNDDRTLINVVRQEKNWSSQRLLSEFPRTVGPAAEEN